jgi:hypothetical protein
MTGIETREANLAAKRDAESQQARAPEAAGQSLKAALVRRLVTRPAMLAMTPVTPSSLAARSSTITSPRRGKVSR